MRPHILPVEPANVLPHIPPVEPTKMPTRIYRPAGLYVELRRPTAAEFAAMQARLALARRDQDPVRV